MHALNALTNKLKLQENSFRRKLRGKRIFREYHPKKNVQTLRRVRGLARRRSK